MPLSPLSSTSSTSSGTSDITEEEEPPSQQQPIKPNHPLVSSCPQSLDPPLQPDLSVSTSNKDLVQSVLNGSLARWREEIFSSWTHKTEHFQRIHRRTGVPLNSMLFFDDEDRNIEAVSKMGATSILVGNGVNLEKLRQGLSNFARNSVSPGGSKQK